MLLVVGYFKTLTKIKEKITVTKLKFNLYAEKYVNQHF